MWSAFHMPDHELNCSDDDSANNVEKMNNSFLNLASLRVPKSVAVSPDFACSLRDEMDLSEHQKTV